MTFPSDSVRVKILKPIRGLQIGLLEITIMSASHRESKICLIDKWKLSQNFLLNSRWPYQEQILFTTEKNWEWKVSLSDLEQKIEIFFRFEKRRAARWMSGRHSRRQSWLLSKSPGLDCKFWRKFWIFRLYWDCWGRSWRKFFEKIVNNDCSFLNFHIIEF